MAESYTCFDKLTAHTHTFKKVTKKKRIGVVRTDNHGLIYAYCLGKADRYEALQASTQLYILENKFEPVIPLRDTEIVGCYRQELIDCPQWERENYEKAKNGADNAAWTAEAFSKAFNCPIYESLEEMADPELFDGILIGNCSWYGEDHVELAMPFIKKGIPIFIDKPFASNAKDAALLLKAAREYNCPVFCSSILYYDDMNRALLDKKLGKTHLVVSTFGASMHQRNASVHTLSALLGAVRYSNGDDYKVESITYIGTGDPTQSRGSTSDGAKEPHNEIYRVEFADGTLGILNMEGFGHYAFHVEVYAETGISSEYSVEQSLRGGIVEISYDFAKMIDTRIPPIEYDRIFEFVATIDAGLRSREEGRTVTLQEIADEAGWTFGISDKPAEEEKK
ncbi:MAG: Gfo/Idh/MocA family oxidoreductase [Clostridia bacterium]|nr:Gfo/Idh/MocA family oxidoreductase [Clostridia bacterium]